jgi:hypothetical protein
MSSPGHERTEARIDFQAFMMDPEFPSDPFSKDTDAHR